MVLLSNLLYDKHLLYEAQKPVRRPHLTRHILCRMICHIKERFHDCTSCPTPRGEIKD